MIRSAKKILAVAMMIVAIFLPVSMFVSTPAHAAGAGRTGSKGDCNLLGFISWDCNIVDVSPSKSGSGDSESDEGSSGKDGEDLIQQNIWTIASNIAADVAVAATYLIIGYVIYGGYLYTFSNGDPGKIANGRKTLANAFIGLAIVILTDIILTAIRVALTNGSGNFQNCVSDGDGCVKPDEMVSSFITWVVSIAGTVSAVFLVYGAILYITSSGDPTKIKRAKDTILYSLIGLAIVALATMITTFVSSTIRDASSSAYYIEEKTITKKEIS